MIHINHISFGHSDNDFVSEITRSLACSKIQRHVHAAFFLRYQTAYIFML